MKIYYSLLYIFLGVYLPVYLLAQGRPTPVFTAGMEGYRTYRIPAITALPNGQLLAFCEGRVNDAGDFGNIDIVMKRSTDRGKTWTALQTIVDADSLQAGNPAPVLDLKDPRFPQGRIFLFYNTGNNHEGSIREGKGLREVWYKTSADGGLHWSEAVNITTQVHRPKQPQVNPAYNFVEDWRSYANTPGHAVQIYKGKYDGRIYVAANHSAGNPQPHFTDYTAHGFFTDDHGNSFTLGLPLPVAGSNESMVVPLSNNRLMLNCRNQRGDKKARIIAISSNGGQSWDSSYFDYQLPDPVCQGSILQVGTLRNRPVLAFCNAADTLRRDHLTLRISFDEGQHWQQRFSIDSASNGSKVDYTAYSDLARLDTRRVGILYEKDNYKAIVFTTIRWR
jgi:sialidase-1